MNVIPLKQKNRPTRQQALQWLMSNNIQWQDDCEIGPDMFYGWRFIKPFDEGNSVFANCIEPGITAMDLANFKQSVA